MATQRTYRKFTARQKLEIVLAGVRGDRSVKDLCREHEIAETLYYSWRDKLIEGGKQGARWRRRETGGEGAANEDPLARARPRAQDLRVGIAISPPFRAIRNATGGHLVTDTLAPAARSRAWQ